MPSSNNMTVDCPPDEVDTLEGLQQEVMMDPSTIRYTQDKISSLFARRPFLKKVSDRGSRNGGSYSEALKGMPTFTIKDTLQQLRDGTLAVDDVPAIRVVNYGGQYRSLDNRRLWVFKEYGKRIPVIVKPVDEEFFQKNTTDSDGLKVTIIDDRRGKQAKFTENESFLGIVLRWTIKDVMNERIFVNKVVAIPETFPDLRSYYRAFRWLFIEENRGQLQNSLEAIGGAPYMSLHIIEEDESASGNKGSAEGRELRKLKLFTSGKYLVQRNAKRSPWKPKPTDLLLLCTLVPKSLKDLKSSGVLYTFAMISVAENLEDEDDNALSYVAGVKDDVEHMFKATAFLPTGCPEQLDIAKSESPWYAVYLENVATALRIWNALNSHLSICTDETLLQERPLVQETLCIDAAQVYRQPVKHICSTADEGNIIYDGLHDVIKQFSPEDGEIIDDGLDAVIEQYTPEDGEIIDDGLDAVIDDGLDSVIDQYCDFRGLNTSQTEAVRLTVMGLMKKEGFRVRLIQGPPGTGKTSTVTTFVSIISCLKNRLLVSAPTNRAVSEVAERFLLNLRNGLSSSTQFYDFTSVLVGGRFCRPLQVGDVLISGNEDKIDTDGVLGEIFLSSRVKRLQVALAPLSGWRHTAQLLVDFLTNPFEDFEMHTELMKEKPEKTPPLNFLEFIQDRLKLMGNNVMENGIIMCNDLPSKLLSWNTRKIIEEACGELKKLLEYLDDKHLTIETAEGWFRTADRSDTVNHWDSCKKFSSAKIKLLALISSKPGYVLDTPILGPPTIEGLKVLCVQHACVVFSTTSNAGSFLVRTSGPFDYAVIDEAAQLVEAETAIVTQLQGVSRALLVGDPKQLQAGVTSQVAKDFGYGRSLFERLQNLGHPCHVLDTQYRMHPAIGQFPNRQFYGGAVRDGPNVLSEDYQKPYQKLYGPYAFIDVKSGGEESDKQTKSWRNMAEAEVVSYVIEKIRGTETKLQNLTVGVITPYQSQVQHLNKRLNGSATRESNSSSKHVDVVHVDVKTVDGFQGGERDVILFSAVRSNRGGHIGFVGDERRLNVALTRGRYCLFIIGDSLTLAAGNSMWRSLVEDAKRRYCYHDARNDPDLKKTIVRVKNKLEQFPSSWRHDSIFSQGRGRYRGLRQEWRAKRA